MSNIHAQRLNDVIGVREASSVMTLRREVISPRASVAAVRAAPGRRYHLLDAIALLGMTVGVYTMVNGDPALAADLEPYVGPVFRVIDAVMIEAQQVVAVIMQG